jgi:hypothetical protein
MKKLVLLFAVITLAFSSVVPSVVLNQNSPKYGDSVNFTVIFPKKADIKSNSPFVEVECHQDGLTVYQRTAGVVSKLKLDGRMYSGQTSDIIFEDDGDEFFWNEGSANCTAKLYYFKPNRKLVFLAGQYNINVSQKENVIINEGCQENIKWGVISIQNYFLNKYGITLSKADIHFLKGVLYHVRTDNNDPCN